MLFLINNDRELSVFQTEDFPESRITWWTVYASIRWTIQWFMIFLLNWGAVYLRFEFCCCCCWRYTQPGGELPRGPRQPVCDVSHWGVQQLRGVWRWLPQGRHQGKKKFLLLENNISIDPPPFLECEFHNFIFFLLWWLPPEDLSLPAWGLSGQWTTSARPRGRSPSRRTNTAGTSLVTSRDT